MLPALEWRWTDVKRAELTRCRRSGGQEACVVKGSPAQIVCLLEVYEHAAKLGAPRRERWESGK